MRFLDIGIPRDLKERIWQRKQNQWQNDHDEFQYQEIALQRLMSHLVIQSFLHFWKFSFSNTDCWHSREIRKCYVGIALAQPLEQQRMIESVFTTNSSKRSGRMGSLQSSIFIENIILFPILPATSNALTNIFCHFVLGEGKRKDKQTKTNHWKTTHWKQTKRRWENWPNRGKAEYNWIGL